MDLTKAQLLLNKINRLYKSMSLDPESVAQIEKDLMRDYIKSLYDAFNDESITKASVPVRKMPARIPKPEPKLEPEPKRYEATVVNTPPVKERIIAPPPVVERIIAPPPVERRVVESLPPTTAPPEEAVAPSFSNRINEEDEELFMLEGGAELSHKLSSLPIADLNKAMGINERIFTINELFRGDSRAFKHTMSELNQLPSFSEAKTYLAKNVVNQYDWTNKARTGKAKIFIKLIRRRYL